MWSCFVPAVAGRWFRTFCGTAAGLLVAAGPLLAVEFPQSPQQWLNSPPLSWKQVEGKGVLLYFFSESDPECLQRWPEMTALAKEYEDQPVLFIAVNSGGQRNLIEQYAQQVNLTWPVVLDPDRSFAKKFPIEKVTPDNGMQVAVINADGSIGPGSWQAHGGHGQRGAEGRQVEPRSDVGAGSAAADVVPGGVQNYNAARRPSRKL